MTDWDSLGFGNLTCREFVELVTDFLEDRMGAELRLRFEQHLADCPGCERYLDQIRVTRRVVGNVAPDPLPAEMRDQLVAAFRAWRSGRGSTST